MFALLCCAGSHSFGICFLTTCDAQERMTREPYYVEKEGRKMIMNNNDSKLDENNNNNNDDDGGGDDV